eukprot:957137-Prorocentrum_minimum.AAC.1
MACLRLFDLGHDIPPSASAPLEMVGAQAAEGTDAHGHGVAAVVASEPLDALRVTLQKAALLQICV